MRKWFDRKVREGPEAIEPEDAASRSPSDQAAHADEKRGRDEQMQGDREPVQSEPQAHREEGEAIRILSDVESQLHALRAMHEENQAKESDLKLREQHIEQALSELHAAQTQLMHERAESEEQAATASKLENELTSERETLAQQRRLVDSRAQQVNDDLETAHQLSEELEEREKGLTQSNDRTAELENALRDQAARTEDAQVLAAERAEELLRVHEQISVASNEAETIGRRLTEVDHERAEFSNRVASLEEQLSGNSAIQQELDVTKQQLTQANEQIQVASGEADSARVEVSESEQRQSDLRDHIASLEQQVAGKTAVEQDLNETKQNLTRTLDQLSACSTTTESTKAQLAESVLRGGTLQDQIVALEQQLSSNTTTQHDFDDAKSDLAEARTQLKATSGKDERIASLESDLDRAVSGLEQLKSRYETNLSEAAGEAETSQAELTDAVEALKNNNDRLRELEHGAQATKVHWQRRRERLAGVRSSVHGKRDQVARAIVKLKERQVECERVLKQRGDVERGRKELRSKRRQAEHLIARYKGSKFAMFLMGAMVLLMGMSWGVASHFVQATYMASATLMAENKDRPMESFELTEWQTYHEAMFADPQFHAMASDRFRRRAITSLGKPAEVGEFVSESVHLRSNRAGDLTIEISGTGQERTELLLNTLVTAARSFAEGARTQRTDGAATIISQDAIVGDGPLHDQRPMYAGGVFMGSVLLMFGLGAPAWRRLSAASSEFDKQEKANEVGAEADWVEPELLKRKS